MSLYQQGIFGWNLETFLGRARGMNWRLFVLCSPLCLSGLGRVVEYVSEVKIPLEKGDAVICWSNPGFSNLRCPITHKYGIYWKKKPLLQAHSYLLQGQSRRTSLLTEMRRTMIQRLNVTDQLLYTSSYAKITPFKPWTQWHAFSLIALLVLSWYGINYNALNTLKHSVDILISVNMLTRLLVILCDLLDIGLVISDPGVNRWLDVFLALPGINKIKCEWSVNWSRLWHTWK